MVGYIEDLELISVSDILKDDSINTTSGTLALNESQQLHADLQNYTNTPDYENIQKLECSNSLRIPNPVGYLQEFCVKRGFDLPVYGILKQDGPPHEPTFSTFCRVKDHYRVVASKSKKTGKEMAAREVIMCLRTEIDAQPKNENDTLQIVKYESNPETSSASSKPTRTMNYVGYLQEFCVRKQLPPPFYGTEKSTGTPNNPSFYIFCQIGQHREVGIASNKKSAKQLAAEKILGLLDMKTKSDPSFSEGTIAENNEIIHTTTSLNTKDIQVLSDSATKTFVTIPNPVGHLQELCVKYRLRPPVYEIVRVDGPPHLPTFTTLCKVEHLCEEAVSSNKKKGKEISASKILNALMERDTKASTE